MLTISNGWFSNTISQSRIINIAKAAQSSAGAETIDHACDMAPIETIVDYVFCGSVKQEFMMYLLAMARNRTLWENEAGKSTQTRSTPRMDMYRQEIQINEQQIKRLLLGNTLEFGTKLTVDAAGRENYLIYKEKTNDRLLGLPLALKDSSQQPTSKSNLSAPVPNFPSLQSIQFRDFAAIQKRGQFYCQGQTYLVRFTDKNGPVVMCLGAQQQDVRMQKVLTHCWAFSIVKNKLAGVNKLSLTDSIIRPAQRDMSADGQALSGSNPMASANSNWQEFSDTAQENFSQVFSSLHKTLNAHRTFIAKQLNFLEALEDPLALDIDKFLMTQQELISFEKFQKSTNISIKYFKHQLEHMVFAYRFTEDSEHREKLHKGFLDLIHWTKGYANSAMIGHRAYGGYYWHDEPKFDPNFFKPIYCHA